MPVNKGESNKDTVKNLGKLNLDTFLLEVNSALHFDTPHTTTESNKT